MAQKWMVEMLATSIANWDNEPATDDDQIDTSAAAYMYDVLRAAGTALDEPDLTPADLRTIREWIVSAVQRATRKDA